MKDTQFFTTVELLELLRRKYSRHDERCSDYRLSRVLGVTPKAISHLLHHNGVMSDETAVKVANELDIPPLLVVFSVIRERSKNQAMRDILDTLPPLHKAAS